MKKYILIVFLLFLPFSLEGATIRYKGLVISDMVDFEYYSRGYNVIRLNITNETDLKRTIKLYYTHYRGIREISKTFTVEPRESVEKSMVFSSSALIRSSLKVKVDGKEVPSKHGTLGEGHVRGLYYKRGYAFYIDPAIHRKYMETVSRNLNSSHGHDYTSFAGSDDQFYKTWLAYTRYDCMYFYTSSFVKFPLEVQQAIFDYVRLGGRLALIGEEPQLPSDFKFVDRDDKMEMRIYASGSGAVYKLKEKEQLLDMYNSSGKKLPGDKELTTCIDVKAFDAILDDLPLIQYNTASIEFSDAELLALKPYQFAGLALIFVILLGPINIYWLSKKKRMVLIFVTVPLISSVLCGSLGLYYFIFERGVLNVKKEVITFLDENTNQAYTLAGYGIFSARSRPRGLKFSDNTAVYPSMRGGGVYANEHDLGNLRLDSGQHFAEGWIHARVPRSFRVFSKDHCRERVLFTKEAGGYKVVNGLGVDIKELVYLAEDRNYYECKNIKAGKTGVLSKANINFASPLPFYKYYKADRKDWFSSFRSRQNRHIGVGQYKAVLEDTPFVKQEFEKKAKVSSLVYLYGNAVGEGAL